MPRSRLMELAIRPSHDATSRPAPPHDRRRLRRPRTASAGRVVIVTYLVSDRPSDRASSSSASPHSGAMEEHPVILWLMVADHALLDTQGKLSVIGMFDRLFAPQFPSVHPIAFIIAQWQWRP